GILSLVNLLAVLCHKSLFLGPIFFYLVIFIIVVITGVVFLYKDSIPFLANNNSVVQPATYINNKYKFQLNFSENWRGYKVRERKISGNTTYIEFARPTKNTVGLIPVANAQTGDDYVFGIVAYDKTAWENTKTGIGTNPALLVKKGEVYLSYGVNTASLDDKTLNTDEVISIIGSGFLNPTMAEVKQYNNQKFNFSIDYPGNYLPKTKQEDSANGDPRYLEVDFGPAGALVIRVISEIGGDRKDMAGDFRVAMDVIDSEKNIIVQGKPAIDMVGWAKLYQTDSVVQKIHMVTFEASGAVYALVNTNPLAEKLFSQMINSIKISK
ncbi:MAG TPA: hypothetical protein VJH75_03070, partial [Patescibacteria group bacterium]|nr:hypothetical protein [Patescibacteria group bacterium]